MSVSVISLSFPNSLTSRLAHLCTVFYHLLFPLSTPFSPFFPLFSHSSYTNPCVFAWVPAFYTIYCTFSFILFPCSIYCSPKLTALFFVRRCLSLLLLRYRHSRRILRSIHFSIKKEDENLRPQNYSIHLQLKSLNQDNMNFLIITTTIIAMNTQSPRIVALRIELALA